MEKCLNETYDKVCIGKHMFDGFPIQNGLKQKKCFVNIAF